MAKRHDLEKVIAIGDDLFRQKGYHDTGTDEILKTADFPRSSFYHHFGNKEGFAEKTVEHYGQRVLAFMKSYLEDPEKGPPLSRLRQYFFTIMEMNQEANYESSCLVQRFAMDVSSQPGVLQSATQEQFSQWLDIVETCVKEGQEEEEIRNDIPARTVAKMLFSGMYGGFTISRLSRENQDYDDVIESIFDLVYA